MNKIIITLLVVATVIGAIIVGIFIYMPGKGTEEKLENTIIQDISVGNLTDSEGTNNIEKTTNMIETNSSEERISPNAFITFEQTYKECGHTTSEFMEIPQEFVNLTKEELNEKYSDWTVEKFTDTDIILNRKVEGSCNEHYIVRNLNGIVTVFHILDDGTEEKYMVTDIATEYLTDTDKVEMEKGIEVNGKQNLNQLIEDFE